MADNIPFGVGSGSFITRFVSGGISIASGQTGNLATITPPSGQKVRLTSLTTNNSANNQFGVSVSANGVLITGPSLSLSKFGRGGAGVFGVGVSVGENGACEGFTSFMDFGSDEVVTIDKNAGNTIEEIVYSYEFGE